MFHIPNILLQKSLLIKFLSPRVQWLYRTRRGLDYIEQQTSNEGSGRFHNHGEDPYNVLCASTFKTGWPLHLCPNYMSTFLGLTLVYHNHNQPGSWLWNIRETSFEALAAILLYCCYWNSNSFLNLKIIRKLHKGRLVNTGHTVYRLHCLPSPLRPPLSNRPLTLQS